MIFEGRRGLALRLAGIAAGLAAVCVAVVILLWNAPWWAILVGGPAAYAAAFVFGARAAIEVRRYRRARLGLDYAKGFVAALERARAEMLERCTGQAGCDSLLHVSGCPEGER